MIGPPSGTRVWIAAGHTDMRKCLDGLAALVQTALAANLHSGHVFVFRGRRSEIIKVLWSHGQGLLLQPHKGCHRGPSGLLLFRRSGAVIHRR